MLTNKDGKLFSKVHLNNLFRQTELYHRRKLREMFRQYYNPGESMCVWTTHLPEKVIQELRVHLSWELGIRTFRWSREAIGTRIILRFQELGIFLFMKHVIVQERT